MLARPAVPWLPDALAPRLRLLRDVLEGYRLRWAALLLVSSLAPAFLALRIWLLKILVDTVLLRHRVDLAATVAAAIAGTGILRAGANLLAGRLSGSISAGIVFGLRARMFRAILGTSLAATRRQRLGDLLTRLSTDVGAVSDLVCSASASAVSQVSTVVLFVALLALISPPLLLLGLAVVPIVVVLSAFEARASRRAQVVLRESTAALTERAQERLSAVATVKALSASGYEARAYARLAADAARAQAGVVRVRSVYPAAAEVLAALAAGAVVWEGARLAASGAITTGDVVAFVSYLLAVFAPIRGLGASSGVAARAGVGLDRIAEVFATARLQPDPVRPVPVLEQARLSPRAPEEPQAALDPGAESALAGDAHRAAALELDDVWFGYEPGHPVLRGVSLRVEPGEVVAVVGPSGAGKTTLVSLALGFYAPDSGEVHVAGTRLATLAEPGLRRAVSAVLQEPMVFDGTIRDNVEYDRPRSAGAVRAALAEADLLGVAASHAEQGIGPRGASLSGGERHRLALARALARTPSVLVLDEPTASLDTATEGRVCEALRADRPERAVLLVTHSAATLEIADRVFELRCGRLVERRRGSAAPIRGRERSHAR